MWLVLETTGTNVSPLVKRVSFCRVNLPVRRMCCMIFQPADLKTCWVLQKTGLLNLRELAYTGITDFRVRLPGFKIYRPCIICMILGKVTDFPLLWYSHMENGSRNFTYLSFMLRRGN